MAPKRSTKKAKAPVASNSASPAPAPAAELAAAPSDSSSDEPASSSPFARFRAALRAATQSLVENLRARREAGAVEPVPEDEMIGIVEQLIEEVGDQGAAEGEEPWRRDVRKHVIDRVLEEMLFGVATRQSEANDFEQSAYDLLSDLLDVVLTFSELEYAESTLPLSCLGYLLDLQTIAGCHHIFAYIESRVERLTKNMHPQKGKGPLLLRLLNELLRRLPKSKTEHVIFSGRILMFLSSVFPLGEKSGVNLRGNFNVGKGTVFEGKEGEGEAVKTEGEETKPDPAAMEVDKPTMEQEDFYTTFWSLQIYFNNPPLLFVPFAAASSGSSTPVDPFSTLRHGLTKTLDAFADATKKEKELLGSGKEGGKPKAKAVGDVAMAEEEPEVVMEHYFFPKILTSRNLLELELADPAFRRQILVQILVLFQYLLSFTPPERAKSLALPTTNLPALPPHVLSPPNEKWINELRTNTLAEMHAMEGGARFRKTVELILHREQNWINWKLKSCLPFEKPPLPPAKAALVPDKVKSMMRDKPRYPFKLGNATLSKLWERNTTTLEGFEREPTEESFDRLVRDWKMTNRMITQRKAALATLGAGARSVPGAVKMTEIGNELEKLDKKAKALHWRAIRVASTTHLHLFSKIKAGDLDALVDLMETERQEQEERAEAIGEGEPLVEEVKEDDPKGVVSLDEAVEVRAKVEEGADASTPDADKMANSRTGTPGVATPKDPGTPKRTRTEDDTMMEDEPETKKLKNGD